MQKILLGNTTLEVPSIALGCMRISKMSVEEVEKLIGESLKLGINFFDHADIYGNTVCESLFGEVLKRNPAWREKMIIQTKIGIVLGKMYDSTPKHFLDGVDAALKRLHTSYIDVLLVHRPDALTNWKELGVALKELHDSGKVHYFGVSNFNEGQMKLFEKYVGITPVANQLQLSLAHTYLIDQGIFENRHENEAIDRVGGALEHCMLEGITVQPWSVMMGKDWSAYVDSPNYPQLNKTLEALAEKYHATKNAVAIAWILKHPAKMQPIVGTTSVQHLQEMAVATKINLTNQEWYDLYLHDKKLP